VATRPYFTNLALNVLTKVFLSSPVVALILTKIYLFLNIETRFNNIKSSNTVQKIFFK
jgi:hypothetical protein